MGEVRVGAHKTSMREIVDEADQSDQSTPDAGQATDKHGDRTSEYVLTLEELLCVGKERSTGLGALKWAIDTNFIPAEGYIRLLHVMRPLRFIRNRMSLSSLSKKTTH
ncbi:hypothetical protein KP509_15G025200 [Ceratopteris richardii]|uniref:Uncharacterized protein n=1 Tax=Ceratopteris richardii TaxID=49495 RepID=A0A8T2T3K1_CERRI|nr:hypothetical protein KP509_15G025200 [Ceratopteris richardii]